MALQRDTKYPGRFEVGDTAHPQGAFKNRTTPTSEDGSYLEKDWLNDMSAPLERAISLAGITVSGTADDATESQYFEAIHKLSTAWAQYADAGAANAYVLTNNVSPIKAPIDGMRVRFYANNASTGPATVNFSDFDPVIAAKDIKLQDGSAIGVGDIDTTIENEIVFDATVDDWVLVRGAGTISGGVETVTGDGVDNTDPKNPVINQIFTEYFVSTEQTITSGGSLTIAHGLSARPTHYQAEIVCKIADFGFSVNDVLIINPGTHGGTIGSKGLSIVGDASNIFVRFGSDPQAFAVVNKSTGNTATITNSSWRLILRAYV